MRKIYTDRKVKIVNPDEISKSKVFATVDGVLEPIVYDTKNTDGTTLKDDVVLTPDSRLLKRKTARNTVSVSTVQEIVSTTTTTPQKGTVVTKSEVTAIPSFVYEYRSGFSKITSNQVETWDSSFGRNTLTQSDANKRPDVGFDGKGTNKFVPASFVQENFDFLTFTTTETLSGDFTIFISIKAIPYPLPKLFRLLGKSDDNDMYLSIGESANKSYKISFASGSTVEVPISSLYWESHNTRVVVTIQRKSNVLTIRENGTQVFTGTTPTSDFVFDQLGKLGNDGFNTFNGNIYHISAYNTFISTNLERFENSIIKQTSLATE